MGDARETKVGVLDKAMTILFVFPGGDVALLPQEIAERTGMPLPTVYRLVQALCEHGMLMKDGPRFRLGLTLLRLGMLVVEGIDVRKQAQRHLKWLNEQTGENAELHIRQEEMRMVIEMMSSPHNLRPFADVGAPLPLHLGAAGKVLLAWLSPSECQALVKASAARFGNGEEAFDLHKLFSELADIRAAGWASSSGERAAGVSAIAAPIFDASGQVAGAMTLVTPTARQNDEQRARAIPLVREAARRTSYDLGYVTHK
ncbi:MAG: IclR family transcriptional regulator [Ktedonobacteraceae bacterium]|nr:IclR family transcriptional regulator [Chloroflexota bacterium]